MQAISNEEFGQFLTKRRKEKGLTQKQLAEQLYLSDKAVSKWERGLSFPDISLLIPLAKILEVTTTELLCGKRMDSSMPFTAQEVETLMKKTISLSKEDRERIRYARQRRKLIFFSCVLILCFETIMMFLLGHTKVDLFNNIGVVVVLMFIFGTYFTFFAKETLPAYYDENKISFYSDGIFRINVAGVRFNNSNWSHILEVVHLSASGIMVAFPLLYFLISYLNPILWENGKLVFTFCAVFLLFIPLYIAGKKYE